MTRRRIRPGSYPGWARAASVVVHCRTGMSGRVVRASGRAVCPSGRAVGPPPAALAAHCFLCVNKAAVDYSCVAS